MYQLGMYQLPILQKIFFKGILQNIWTVQDPGEGVRLEGCCLYAHCFCLCVHVVCTGWVHVWRYAHGCVPRVSASPCVQPSFLTCSAHILHPPPVPSLPPSTSVLNICLSVPCLVPRFVQAGGEAAEPVGLPQLTYGAQPSPPHFPQPFSPTPPVCQWESPSCWHWVCSPLHLSVPHLPCSPPCLTARPLVPLQG